MVRVRENLPWRRRGVRHYRAIVDSTGSFFRTLTFKQILYCLSVVVLFASLVFTCWLNSQAVEPKFFWHKAPPPKKWAQISIVILSFFLGGLLALPLFRSIYKISIEQTELIIQVIRTELKKAEQRQQSRKDLNSKDISSGVSSSSVESSGGLDETEKGKVGNSRASVGGSRVPMSIRRTPKTSKAGGQR